MFTWKSIVLQLLWHFSFPSEWIYLYLYTCREGNIRACSPQTKSFNPNEEKMKMSCEDSGAFTKPNITDLQHSLKTQLKRFLGLPGIFNKSFSYEDKPRCILYDTPPSYSHKIHTNIFNLCKAHRFICKTILTNS